MGVSVRTPSNEPLRLNERRISANEPSAPKTANNQDAWILAQTDCSGLLVQPGSGRELLLTNEGFCEFCGPRRSREDARRAHLQREDRQEVHGERHGPDDESQV